MRKMAHIETVRELLPIPDADQILMAKVLDWELVVRKGEFKEGNKCVYIEIDSLLPENNPNFAFMEPRKYRVKTIRLRGQISQGLALPITILPEEKQNLEPGEDVSEILNIIKYEPPIHPHLRGKVKGLFPSFLRKTDEERIQNCGWLLEVYRGVEVYLSEKLDGSSMTTYIRNGEFGVCSRNLELKREDEDKLRNAFWICADAHNIEQRLRSLNMNIALQGELIGPNIQKNRLRLTELKCLFYNVFNIDESKYFDFVDFVRIIRELGLETVPIITETMELDHTPKELITMAVGNSTLYQGGFREGLVFRAKQELIVPRHGRFSFKAINPEYLLKYGE